MSTVDGIRSVALALLMVCSVLGVAAPASATTGPTTASPAAVDAGAPADRNGDGASGASAAAEPTTAANASGATIVVDASGGGDYETIQAGVDAASDGDTVEVRSATYEEEVFVDENVTVVAPNGATLDGSSFSDEPDGFSIDTAAAPTVEGFTITNYDVGVQVMPDSRGDWTLSDVEIRNSGWDAVRARYAYGDFRIEDAVIEDNTGRGVVADESSGDWVIADTTIADNDGDPGFSTFKGVGVDARGSAGDWTIRDSEIRDHTDHASVGVNAPGSSGEWSIVDSTVENQRYSVDASGASGAWSVSGSTIAADGRPTPGSTASNNAIRAAETTGDWSISDTTVTSALIGIQTRESQGDWTITGANVTGNLFGVHAPDTTGTWSVQQSEITANSEHGIDATGANPEGEATGNWWGQSSGPQPDQCVGNVTCADPLSGTPGDQIGSCTVIDEPGRYEVVADLASDETCLEIRASDVTIDGQGHLVEGLDPNTYGAGVYANGSDGGLTNVSVADLELTGWRHDGFGNTGHAVLFETVDDGSLTSVSVTGGDYGVQFVGTTNSVLADVAIANTDSGPYAVEFESGSDGNTVRNLTVDDPSEGGIRLASSQNTDFTGLDVSNAGAGLILASGSGATTVADGEFRQNGHGVNVDGGSDVAIRNNTIVGSGNHGIRISQAGLDYYVEGNTLRNNGNHGIRANRADNTTVVDNTVVSSGGHGINLQRSNEHAVRDNRVRENGRFGVNLNDVRNATVADNVLARNANGGIRLVSGSADNELRSNSVGNNAPSGGSGTGTGIQLTNAPNNEVVGNVVANGYHGISLNDSADDNSLTDNVVFNGPDGSWGLLVSDSAGTSVESLTVGSSAAGNTTLSFTGAAAAVGPAASSPANGNAADVGQFFATTALGSGASLDVTVHYVPADLGRVDESSLSLWSNDGSAWSEVSGASADENADTVSATLTSFSTHGVFGQATGTATPTQSGSGPDTTSGDGPGMGAAVALVALLVGCLAGRRGVR